ncbi:thymidine phosphorylase, partial [Mesorhizobium sp. M4A.F.Ca.ET.020.02.1.1]
VTLALAADMLQSAGLAASNQDGIRRATETLAGGRAAAVFQRMVAALGGPADFIDKPGKYLPKAPVELAVKALENGFVSGIATREIGLAVVGLGGGRTRPDDRIDHAVGITRLSPVGAEVHAGEPLALVHARNDADAEAAAAAVLACYTIGASKPPAEKTVIRRVLPR